MNKRISILGLCILYDVVVVVIGVVVVVVLGVVVVKGVVVVGGGVIGGSALDIRWVDHCFLGTAEAHYDSY